MTGRIVVMEPAEFEHGWRGRTSPARSPRRAHSCSGSSAAAAATAQARTVRAPALDGLYGKPVPLSDGTIEIADERYIRDSILKPRTQDRRRLRAGDAVL